MELGSEVRQGKWNLRYLRYVPEGRETLLGRGIRHPPLSIVNYYFSP